MQRITTTFDRIFDVVASGTPYRHKGMLFSFESAGRNEYGVLVTGNPGLCDGMTVTAILKEPGNWQSLMCWRNHQTGEIAFGGHQPPPSSIFYLIPLGIVAATALLSIFGQDPWLASCGATVFLGYVVGQALAIRRLWRARAMLGESEASSR